MHGSLDTKDDLVLTVRVPIYPPSPTQTAHGLPKSLGHWGYASVSVRLEHFIWIEDLIRTIEGVTNHNLCWADGDSPGAGERLEVEGIAKALGQALREHSAIRWFELCVKNYSEGCNTFTSLAWPEIRSSEAPRH